ncbi:MAG: peptidoglycan DD-metalloendopeptidase family protein [Runella sp.]
MKLPTFLTPLLHRHQSTFVPVVLFDKNECLTLDFTENNQELATLDLQHTAIFSQYILNKLHQANATVGIGGYNEHRTIYRRSPHFQQTDEPRCIHLGIDIWTKAGTHVFAPLEGSVHSFANNAHFGDYGPTIILEHILEDQTFYSLYGHLSLDSLEGLYEGQKVEKGQPIASIGPYPENGDWPPHLHFQLITDMLGLKGDFPGVCTLSEREKFLQLCPNPNLIFMFDV